MTKKKIPKTKYLTIRDRTNLIAMLDFYMNSFSSTIQNDAYSAYIRKLRKKL